MDVKDEKTQDASSSTERDGTLSAEELVNASGHVQELQRNFSLLSLTGIGIVVGNVWPAAGGSILVALYNGGAPGTSDNDHSSVTSADCSRCAL